jgi:hypothetical protein
MVAVPTARLGEPESGPYTDRMPSTFRSRIAIVLILGIFLIPALTSSLRGLTHVLTCSESVAAPFSVIVSDDGTAVVTSSATSTTSDNTGLCGGLSVNMRAGRVVDNRFELAIAVTNGSAYPWQGTVDISLNHTQIPVSIGGIEPGATATDTIPIRLDQGLNELDGSLLVGP